MTKEQVKDVDSNMVVRSDSVSSAPRKSAVKLRWKIATCKLRDKQFLPQQDCAQCKSAHVPGASPVRKNADIKDFRGPGETAWSKLLKKLNDEKQLMLMNSNSFGESTKDYSVRNSATVAVNTIQLQEKSPSASRIMSRSDVVSRTDNDRSRSTNWAMTGVSSASKFLYPKFNSNEAESYQTCDKGGV